jgi:O-methyltransferase
MDGAEAIQYVLQNEISGCIVECGVDAGHFEHVWINELQKATKERDIYMYDTFKGLTEPGEFDYTADTATIYKMSSNAVYNEWNSKRISDDTNSWCYTPLEKVQHRLESTGYNKEKLHYIVGDILKTLQQKENVPYEIAILRLDTDWYESSKIELEVLYPKVVSGGVVIFDDYYHWDGQRRATDDYFRSQGITVNMVNLGNGKTGAFIKR